MRSLACFVALLSALFASSAAQSNFSTHTVLAGNFQPPQIFKNVNLLRNINLEKSYIKETINVVIENIDDKPQVEYLIPFKADLIGKVGGLEVRYKKDPEKPPFSVALSQYDSSRLVVFALDMPMEVRVLIRYHQ
jgi:oligosaccharyltransferase complex subunit alpha (ribophorin I)